MTHWRFVAVRLPSHVPPGVRKAIRKEGWRTLRRSPAFWLTFFGFMLLIVASELVALWATERFGDPVQTSTIFLVFILLIPLYNLTHNWLFDRTRRSIWQAHAICPDCGYNLTGNTTGVCPECGTPQFEQAAPAETSTREGRASP